MARLRPAEKLVLERLLEMESGYVLNFTDASMAEFFLDTVGVDIDDQERYGDQSKAKRMRAFWAIESDDLVGRLLSEAIEYRAALPAERHEDDEVLVESGRQIVSRLLGRGGGPAGLPLAYRLESSPLRGGQAEVFKGQRKSDGMPVAVKRSTNEDAGRIRLRREINTQRTLSHPNVMPVVDHDADGFSWYAMPLGTRTLDEVAAPIDDGTLRVVVSAVLKALAAAESIGQPHRDVKPSNVIEIEHGPPGRRWVLADWGLTRAPLGKTTADLTQTGRLIGTVGYAPPEAYVDGHEVGIPGDLYSLGQLIGWAKTGRSPTPNVAPRIDGPWRGVLRALTRRDIARRPSTVAEAVRLVESAFDGPELDSLDELLAAANSGDEQAAIRACLLAVASHSDDHALFLDRIARLNSVAMPLASSHPEEAVELVQEMDSAFSGFGHRDFDYANQILWWMHQFAVAAAQLEDLEMLEDICEILFPREQGWDRWKQRGITAAWMSQLTGPTARVVADCVRRTDGMAAYLGKIEQARSLAIRNATG